MSLLIKGVNKLSQLEVDVDKDWKEKVIFDLGGIAPGSQFADVSCRGVSVLERIPAGQSGQVLTCKGTGAKPKWDWVPGYDPLKPILAAEVLASRAVGVVAPHQAFEEPTSVGTEHTQSTTPTKAPSIGSAEEMAVATPDKTLEESAAPASSHAEEMTYDLDGAVADDGGLQTDETAEATNDAANDMTLLPAAPAVDDAYYFGYSLTFGDLRLGQGTAGEGVWTIAWEYWNGAAWAGLSGVNDGTNGFRNSGIRHVTFTAPGDWATTTVGGIADLYWIRARVTAYTSITTQPLGTRAWAQRPL